MRTLMPWLPKKKVEITVQYSNEEHMVDAVESRTTRARPETLDTETQGNTWNT